MMWRNILFLCGCLTVIVPVYSEVLKRSDYNRMPKVFQYDDYDECLFSDPGKVATYCLVRAVIKPTNGSELWKMIERFSSNWKMHLNHAALDRGICINSVNETLAGSGIRNISEWVVPKFDIRFPYIIGNDTFRNVHKFRAKYSDLLSATINIDLVRRYGLTAYTEIEYCEESNADDFPIDYLDTSFFVILIILLLVMVLSSWYDYSNKADAGLSHYKKDMTSRKSMLLSSFSVIRNWYRLTSHSREPLSRDLRMIQGVRFVSFMLTLAGHAGMLVQPRSAWEIEQKYRELPTMLIINGFQIVTTFFGISGLVFTIFYVGKMKETNRKPGVAEIVTITVNRYIRLTPVYALMILLEATWFIRMQDGPFWRRGAESSMTYCRRNWWINLLYLNNYYNTDQPCMQHTWYLAADFQMSIVGLVVVTLALNLQRFKIHLIGIITMLSFIVPAVVVYLGEFDGVTIFSPEAKRFVFWYDDAYHKTYQATHMQLHMYMFGIIVGFLYIKFKESKINLRNYPAFRAAFYSNFILMPAVFLAGQIFYTTDFPKPSLWMAAYFAAARIIWALILGFGCFGLIYRVNKQMTRFLNLRIFEVLGRLTYGAYVGHYFIMKMMFYNVREPSNLGVFDFLTKINGTLYLSYLLSLALTMMVELPISAIQKKLLVAFAKPAKSNACEVRSDAANGHKNETHKSLFSGNA